jgi:hypothetical protein
MNFYFYFLGELGLDGLDGGLDGLDGLDLRDTGLPRLLPWGLALPPWGPAPPSTAARVIHLRLLCVPFFL